MKNNKQVFELVKDVQRMTFETLPAHIAEDVMISYLDKLLEEEQLNQREYVGLLELNQIAFDIYEES